MEVLQEIEYFGFLEWFPEFEETSQFWKEFIHGKDDSSTSEECRQDSRSTNSLTDISATIVESLDQNKPCEQYIKIEDPNISSDFIKIELEVLDLIKTELSGASQKYDTIDERIENLEIFRNRVFQGSKQSGGGDGDDFPDWIDDVVSKTVDRGTNSLSSEKDPVTAVKQCSLDLMSSKEIGNDKKLFHLEKTANPCEVENPIQENNSEKMTATVENRTVSNENLSKNGNKSEDVFEANETLEVVRQLMKDMIGYVSNEMGESSVNGNSVHFKNNYADCVQEKPAEHIRKEIVISEIVSDVCVVNEEIEMERLDKCQTCEKTIPTEGATNERCFDEDSDICFDSNHGSSEEIECIDRKTDCSFEVVSDSDDNMDQCMIEVNKTVDDILKNLMLTEVHNGDVIEFKELPTSVCLPGLKISMEDRPMHATRKNSMEDQALHTVNVSEDRALQTAISSEQDRALQTMNVSKEDQALHSVNVSEKDQALHAVNVLEKKQALHTVNASVEDEALHTVDASEEDQALHTVNASEEDLALHTVNASEEDQALHTVNASEEDLALHTVNASVEDEALHTVDASEEDQALHTVNASEEDLALHTVNASEEDQALHTVNASEEDLALHTVNASVEDEALHTVDASEEDQALHTVNASEEDLALHTVNASEEDQALHTVNASEEDLALHTVNASVEDEALHTVDASEEDQALHTVNASEEDQALHTVNASEEDQSLQTMNMSKEDQALHSVNASVEDEALHTVDASEEDQALHTVNVLEKDLALHTVNVLEKDQVLHTVNVSKIFLPPHSVCNNKIQPVSSKKDNTYISLNVDNMNHNIGENGSVLECRMENSKAAIKKSLSYEVYKVVEAETHDLVFQNASLDTTAVYLSQKSNTEKDFNAEKATSGTELTRIIEDVILDVNSITEKNDGILETSSPFDIDEFHLDKDGMQVVTSNHDEPIETSDEILNINEGVVLEVTSLATLSEQLQKRNIDDVEVGSNSQLGLLLNQDDMTSRCDEYQFTDDNAELSENIIIETADPKSLSEDFDIKSSEVINAEVKPPGWTDIMNNVIFDINSKDINIKSSEVLSKDLETCEQILVETATPDFIQYIKSEQSHAFGEQEIKLGTDLTSRSDVFKVLPSFNDEFGRNNLCIKNNQVSMGWRENVEFETSVTTPCDKNIFENILAKFGDADHLQKSYVNLQCIKCTTKNLSSEYRASANCTVKRPALDRKYRSVSTKRRKRNETLRSKDGEKVSFSNEIAFEDFVVNDKNNSSDQPSVSEQHISLMDGHSMESSSINTRRSSFRSSSTTAVNEMFPSDASDNSLPDLSTVIYGASKLLKDGENISFSNDIVIKKFEADDKSADQPIIPKKQLGTISLMDETSSFMVGNGFEVPSNLGLVKRNWSDESDDSLPDFSFINKPAAEKKMLSSVAAETKDIETKLVKKKLHDVLYDLSQDNFSRTNDLQKKSDFEEAADNIVLTKNELSFKDAINFSRLTVNNLQKTDNHYSAYNRTEVYLNESEHNNGSCLKYVRGSIVCAKMLSYPWWPAMVDFDLDRDIFFKKSHHKNEYCFHVVFFAVPVSRAWIRESQLMPFTTEKELNYVNSGWRSLRATYSTHDLELGMKLAAEAIKCSLSERLDRFSFDQLSASQAVNSCDGSTSDEASPEEERRRLSKRSKKLNKSGDPELEDVHRMIRSRWSGHDLRCNNQTMAKLRRNASSCQLQERVTRSSSRNTQL